MLRRLIREDISVKRTVTTGLWNIMADPAQVEQVIMNLSVNARDAMPNGGVLTIGTSNFEMGEQDARGFVDLKPGRYVVLSITDSGTGMTAEVRRRLFEPFFTTKPLGEGTGLGLSMVYGIVKQHGGEVSVYSEVGLGTTFRIYWPATDRPIESERKASARMSQRGNETILLVEDEKVRKIIRSMLLTLGYEVLEVKQSADALALARQHVGSIDLLLTDVVMPLMNGRELADQISSIRPGIKVVFMSGYPGGTTSAQSIFPPDTLFLQKPFNEEMLSSILRQGLQSSDQLPSA